MIFKTLNSVYELDDTQQRIRRLSGKNPPLKEQGADGEWKDYEQLLASGSRTVIYFKDGNCVVTSAVVDWDVPSDSSD